MSEPIAGTLDRDRPHDLGTFAARPVVLLFEPFADKPYDLFFFHLDGQRFFGRKKPFSFPGDGRTLALKCALVDASMMLGAVVREQVAEAGVFVYYRPLSIAECKACFDRLCDSCDHDLFYPFPYLSDERRERCAPDDYWNTSPDRVAELGAGEAVLRDYTIELLRGFDLDGAVVYDPACSTGEFLRAIKSAYPTIRAIGQDRSRAMVELSRGLLDEVHWGDAMTPMIPEGSADFVFVRFLNLDVVTTLAAHQLFLRVAAICRQGGYLIVLGHTPILLSASWFEVLGLETLRRSGQRSTAAFQYYVLRKTGPLNTPPAPFLAAISADAR